MTGLLLLGCNGSEAFKHPPTTRFHLLPASETGIDFRNDLRYDSSLNIYTYRNFYNGGGVAAGDLNGDGLQDLYFTGNMVSNKLYLNRGNWKFEDITAASGTDGEGTWYTGVCIADVNADGRPDIYVCNAGIPGTSVAFRRNNACYINLGPDKNGIPHFEDRAAALGLNDPGLSTQAAFFDYDLDGDLDLYLLNNSSEPVSSFHLSAGLRHIRDARNGHKLLRNDNGHFTDVSQQAGILGPAIAFGMGVTVGDLDLDGYPDIYVCNDFFERDYLYHNNGNGTFTEQLEKSIRYTSAASMGADLADINNDAFPDLLVTEMLPESDYRIKTNTTFDSPDRLRYTVAAGYYYQFGRNTLQLNKQDGSFSEIACLAGVEATDWSWSALIFDMDNDGWKDIFVANGIAKDLNNQDFLMYSSDQAQRRFDDRNKPDLQKLIDSIPSHKTANYAFQNNKNLTFKPVSTLWGLAAPGFSNGAAYADLDNDGDLDLVVNNVNDPAFIYRNETLHSNYLKINLSGEAENSAAVGAKIYLRAGGKTWYQELQPVRGYQSCVDPRPNFGLGNVALIDTLMVEWPFGKSTLLTGVPANQTLHLSSTTANFTGTLPKPWLRPPGKVLFEQQTAPWALHSGWQHRENSFYDWNRDQTLFFGYSTEGPRLAIGDVNSDGRTDFFCGGAAGQSGAIFVQSNSSFLLTGQAALLADAACEDTDAAFFDADGDGDQDLYVASGGNEMLPLQSVSGDRLYLNDGLGNFSRKTNALPERKPFASACVRPQDYDNDGDTDIFVGMRLIPGKAGVPVGGFLLRNHGSASFEAVQPAVFKNMGMLTDAVWTDLDDDQDPDLVVVGEWMPVRLFLNDDGVFKDVTAEKGLSGSAGLWKRIETGDFNEDQRPDFIVGNMGLNTRLKAWPDKPLTLFFNDFDQNGVSEQILCRYNSGQLLPYIQRNDIAASIPSVKKKMLHFSDYAGKTMQDIFSPAQMKESIVMEAGMLASVVLLSSPEGRYRVVPLPPEAQFAPIFAISVFDFDADGHLDVCTAGNFRNSKPDFGFFDSDYGTMLKGDGKGGFKILHSAQTGFRYDGEARDLKLVKIGGKPTLLLSRNNDSMLFYQIK